MSTHTMDRPQEVEQAMQRVVALRKECPAAAFGAASILAAHVERLEALIADAKDMTGKGPDVMVGRKLLQQAAWASVVADRIEDRLKMGGSLSVTYDSREGVFSSNLGEWPYCTSGTFLWSLASLAEAHDRVEREKLQKRISEIDGSAQL